MWLQVHFDKINHKSYYEFSIVNRIASWVESLQLIIACIYQLFFLHFFLLYCSLFYSIRNHCAYVVEKTVSYTVQDGAAPYVKAEYKKCGWGKKCPAPK